VATGDTIAGFAVLHLPASIFRISIRGDMIEGHIEGLPMKIRFYTGLMIASILLVLVPGALAAPKHADVSAVLGTVGVHGGDKATIAVVVMVHDKLHAQSHTPTGENAIQFVLTPETNPQASFGEVQYPTGVNEHFDALGDLNVYVGKTVIRIPVQINSDAKPGALTLSGKVHFQACNDTTCFPPEDIKFSVDTNIVPADKVLATNPAFADAIAVAGSTPPVEPPHKGGFFDLAHSTWPVAFTAAFLIGIIFNLMPCVLPVLPLKIMGFYEVSQHDRKKSILLGAVFSIGLIASFGVLAVLVVGMKTLNWGGLFQHAWFTGTIAVVLVAMAISTFGFFTVNVPTAMYSFAPRHDTYTGNFLFGILTAALSTPCTFGMFVGLLAWALNQPSWVGVASIMMVGVGMASPYFVLSAVPEVARKFPRTGPWAEVVKQMMGFLLLATAVYFARPFFQKLLSEEVFWWALFAVLAAGGVFLVVRASQLSKNLLPRVIASVIALLIVVPSGYAAHKLTEKPFVWIPFSDAALAAATASGKPVLVDFTATWCGNIQMLQADVTDEGPASKLLNTLNADGAGSVPLTAIYFPHHAQPVLLKGIYSVDELMTALAGGTQ
jgi:suppressor for copper-sensitivity B